MLVYFRQDRAGRAQLLLDSDETRGRSLEPFTLILFGY